MSNNITDVQRASALYEFLVAQLPRTQLKQQQTILSETAICSGYHNKINHALLFRNTPDEIIANTVEVRALLEQIEVILYDDPALIIGGDNG